MVMGSRATEQASSLFSNSSHWKHDVFLSFRGVDTRKNFTDHLYAALLRKGIITFKDDQKLEKGNAISAEILQAIEDSRLSVIIFSRNYASSTWCLDELVKIFECLTVKRQIVLPVFYGVDPSEVRKQTGSFGKAFAEHKEILRENREKVQRWRTAMATVAELSGWDSHNRCESKLIEDIVEEISRKLSCRFSGARRDFVGILSYVEEISWDFNTELDSVYIIGLCGMGGIGKTTIARAVYEEMFCQFEGSSFLASVREVQGKHGLVPLQEPLLSELLFDKNIKIWNAFAGIKEIRNKVCHKRVLVVLDDVDQLDQLQSLAGAHNWFGGGSRIIITTRDEHLLQSHGADIVYRIEGLDHDDAFQLFCWKAFKNGYPPDNYVELSNYFVNYANGLPLALHVLGSFCLVDLLLNGRVHWID